jgi:hypothetical protein
MFADRWIDDMLRLIETEVGPVNPIARTNISIALENSAWAFFQHGQTYWDDRDDDDNDGPDDPEPDPPVPPDDDGEKPDLYALFKIPVMA